MLNVDDVYEYVQQRNLKDSKFKKNIAHLYKKNAQWIVPLYDLLTAVIFFWLRPEKNKRYFFLGNRFSHLIASLPKQEICIIGGPRQLIYCLKNNISYIPNGYFWRLLSQGFTTNVKNKLFRASLNKSNYLKRLVASDAQAILVVENDSLPMQRAFCNIASDADIKTVCIQHGLFQSKTDAKTIDGWKCDYFICYDKNQKLVITGLGISEDKVIIGGFYEPIVKANVSQTNENAIKVLFLGQPWFKYGDDYKEKYLKVLGILSAQFESENIVYAFKPHPWETDAPYLQDMGNLFKGNMNEAIAGYDVFFSFTSTALLEVTMAGKVAVQIYDQQFACDNFENLGYSYSIQSDDLEKLAQDVLKMPPFELEMPEFDNLVTQIKKIAMVGV